MTEDTATPTNSQPVGAPVEASVRPLVERLRSVADELHKLEATMVDAPQGQSLYREAADEIELLRARLAKAEHWTQHAMLMRSAQNAELLRILRGEGIAPACPGDCCGCNHAISGKTAAEYAKRYAWLRENFGQLVIDTDGGRPKREVLRIEVRSGLTPAEAASVDAAIDAAMLPDA